ncbi:MAG: DUF2064 domain-containing protein [Acidimicrobiales bacterium]
MRSAPPSLTIAVLAKAPAAGRVKTRLCPPCSPAQAASLAAAALEDTIALARATPAERHVLVLDGDAADWTGRGLEVVGQRGDGLDQRLAAAFTDLGGPTLLVGMDTPQLTPAELTDAARRLTSSGDDVVGPALDGGFWAIGLQDPQPEDFLGVPMSQATTGAAQVARLKARGRRVRLLDVHRDVDDWDDALAVAALAPTTCFAGAMATVVAALERQGAA